MNILIAILAVVLMILAIKFLLAKSIIQFIIIGLLAIVILIYLLAKQKSK